MKQTGDDSIIDLKKAIGTYGDEQMFKQQLATFDTLSFEPGLSLIHNAWLTKDWKQMEKETKKMKAESG